MRKLSQAEQNRFLICTKNAIDRLLYDPIKYLELSATLSKEEVSQQVRIEIVNLTNIGKGFDLDFWTFAQNCEHSSRYANLRKMFEDGRMMNSLEFIVDSEWDSEAA